MALAEAVVINSTTYASTTGGIESTLEIISNILASKQAVVTVF